MQSRSRDLPISERDFVRADTTGLRTPAHAEALCAAGPQFLTEAFRAYGSLSEDNRVARIVGVEPCTVGSTGEKLFLSVEYERPDPALAEHLFVKFSRHFSDWFHDRRRFELESEIRLYALSRTPNFPVKVPVPYFGDFHGESGTGLLITQRISFGHEGIEPLHAKCMDQDLSRPLEYYQAILSCLARLAGADKSGRLSPELDRLFPFDLENAVREDPINWSEQELRSLVQRYASFVRDCPQFVPAHLATPDFIQRLERYVLAVKNSEASIKRFLHAEPDYVALSHFNANIDNAWFWRDASDQLNCGLFDWQRARKMNLGYALWGALCGADRQIWTCHLEKLVAHFVDELVAHGGPKLVPETLLAHLYLYAVTIGVAGLLDAPSLVESRLPEVAQLSGPQDPLFVRNEGARCFLHVFLNFLSLWDMNDFGEDLEDLLLSMEDGPALGCV